jgi:NADPH2:quinone reductase
MRDIFAFMDKHVLKPAVGARFDFEHIKDACIALDNGSVNGKIVVTLLG